MTPDKVPTAAELEAYDTAMNEVIGKLIQLLYCEYGMSRRAMVQTLLAAAGRFALGSPEVCETYRTVAGIVVNGLIERGELGRPN